jgi:hypothetical protein
MHAKGPSTSGLAGDEPVPTHSDIEQVSLKTREVSFMYSKNFRPFFAENLNIHLEV